MNIYDTSLDNKPICTFLLEVSNGMIDHVKEFFWTVYAVHRLWDIDISHLVPQIMSWHLIRLAWLWYTCPSLGIMIVSVEQGWLWTKPLNGGQTYL